MNGSAVGVGATMTLPMDIRVLADSAKIGFVFAARGIVPDGAASWFLPRVVGISQALEWCLTGRVFQAPEALAGGLVRSLHPADEVLAVATGLARKIATNVAPVSAIITRALLWQMLGADHPMEAHRLDARGIYDTGRMADSAERGSPPSSRSGRRAGRSARPRTCPPGTLPGRQNRRTHREQHRLRALQIRHRPPRPPRARGARQQSLPGPQRGPRHWQALFGGQVAAQALMAAARTVPAGRPPHSLHGYFLRPGRPDRPVILQVARTATDSVLGPACGGRAARRGHLQHVGVVPPQTSRARSSWPTGPRTGPDDPRSRT